MSTRKTFIKCFRAGNLLRKEGAGGFHLEMYWPTSFRRILWNKKQVEIFMEDKRQKHFKKMSDERKL